jgi:DNA primase large subunit
VTIEEFETWAIDRLRVLAEIESCYARNRQYDDIKTALRPHLDNYLPLSSFTDFTKPLDEQRRKDHVSHFVLRLAFCRS